MDALIDPLTGDYAGTRIATLANAVYLRLTTPLGSYWADPTLGSRLHELKRSKNLSRIEKLACQYAEQALAPLTKDGRSNAITVTSTRTADNSTRTGWLMLLIEVEDASGHMQRFQHPVGVA